MKFNNLNIGTRLGIAFAAILFLSAVMLATALWQLGRIANAKAVMTDTTIKVGLANQWLQGIATNSVRTVAKLQSADPADEAVYEKEMKAVSANISKVQKQLEAMVTSEHGKALLNAVAEQRKRYSAMRDEAFRRKVALGAADATLKAFANEKVIPEMRQYVHTVENVVAFQGQLFNEANARIDALQASAQRLLVGAGIAALVCGCLFALFLTRSITRPLAHAVALAEQVASRDLTADIQVASRDEVGHLLSALKRMNDSLLATVNEVRAGTETIVSASQQIASGNLDLSSRTEQQASSLEETASSMEELTSSVRLNADNARQANTLAQTAAGIALRGGEVVTQVVTTMESINASSKKIADIIAVIDGIAFQTNILALNAAVEAARAGEQGRGFAVVASEVRNLAQRSAGAAKEIRTLIADSVDKVEAGGRLVDQAGATMQEIVQGITRVTDVMAEISSASAEQALGIEQVNAAITQMDDVTQQNAALVEEAAAAAASMQDQAGTLAALVNTFKVDAVSAQTRPAPAGQHTGVPSLRLASA
ncbi:methyl-accepting chemotaxis protein [Massilia sp. X63]|uniref:methyl-accepting chemotaxis protein n=1 Tax=Massilia sp. X63 TaxID=3237285 RepID=UPI0034DD623F